MESEVRELLVEELKDAYSAEKQALRCMQKALRMASAPALREGIELHIEQTQTQIERIEQAMEKLQTRPGRKVCEAMRGLVEEAQHSIGEQDGKGPILDLVIVAGMQRIEHYEIAAYGTDIALAEALGEREVVNLLTATLEEEKQTDLKLTEVTQQAIMPAAMEEGAEEKSPLVRSQPGQRPARARDDVVGGAAGLGAAALSPKTPVYSRASTVHAGERLPRRVTAVSQHRCRASAPSRSARVGPRPFCFREINLMHPTAICRVMARWMFLSLNVTS